MEINKILTITDISKGLSDSSNQYYNIFAVDNEGKSYLTSIGCKNNYQSSFEKTFQRLIVVPAPVEEVAVLNPKPMEELK